MRDLPQIGHWIVSNPWIFLILYPLFWAAVCWTVSAVGGWSALAEVYRDTGGWTPVRIWKWRSGQLRFGMHYGNSLTFGAGHEGLSVRVAPFFRIAHPPLFVPWSEITADEKRGWVFRYIRFSFRDVPGVTLTVSETLGRELAGAGDVS